MTTPPRSGVTLASALGDSAPLADLMRRMRDSRARLEAVAGLLPTDLQGEVRAGPLDSAGWTLLVTHSAAAAKVRQLMPLFEAALRGAGWPECAIRIKVLPRS
jgi:hypothetical protein